MTSPRFPGTAVICDGSEVIASVETRISEAACSYPITPSTTMPAVFQAAVADGRTNLWGTPLAFLEPESEHSSASAAEGFALAGGRVVNFTAGQGLILMKEVLYVIAGKRLPVVFHIGARALTSQSLNIHAGHDDVMGVADCGWGILFARNVQEAADFTAIARRVAEDDEHALLRRAGRVPDDAHARERAAARGRIAARVRRRSARSAHKPVRSDHRDHERRRHQPGRIHARKDRAARLLRAARAGTGRCLRRMGRAHRAELRRELPRTGSRVRTRCWSRWAPSPTPRRAVVDHLRDAGRSVGTIGVTAYRPFPADALADALSGARAVAVVERTDEPAAADNPLTRELKAALADRAARGASVPLVVSASAGLGSRDVSAGDLVAVFDWLDAPGLSDGPRWASLGIRHPSALEPAPISLRPQGRLQLARPLDRRARQRDDQQAAGDDHGRAVRQAGAGLSALRLGEEGPSDHLLPDAGRRADPRPRRAEDGRLRAASRRIRLPPGGAGRASSTAGPSSCRARSPIRRPSGRRSRRGRATR